MRFSRRGRFFQGVPGIVLKVIAGVVLVILAVQFYCINRAGRKADKQDKEG